MLGWKTVTIVLVIASAQLTQPSRLKRDENSSSGSQAADHDGGESGHAVPNGVPVMPRLAGGVPIMPGYGNVASVMPHNTAYSVDQGTKKTDIEKDSSEEDESHKTQKPSAQAKVARKKQSSEEDKSKEKIKPAPKNLRPFQMRPVPKSPNRSYPVSNSFTKRKPIPRWYMQHHRIPVRPRTIKPAISMPIISPPVPQNPNLPQSKPIKKDSSEESSEENTSGGQPTPVGRPIFQPIQPKPVYLTPGTFRPPPMIVKRKPASRTSIQVKKTPTPPVKTKPTKIVRPVVIPKSANIIVVRPKPVPPPMYRPKLPSTMKNTPKSVPRMDISSEEDDESSDESKATPVSPPQKPTKTPNRQWRWKQRAWNTYRHYTNQERASWGRPPTWEQHTGTVSDSQSDEDSSYGSSSADSQEVLFHARPENFDSDDSSDSSDEDDYDERYYHPPPRPYCPRIADVIFMLDGSDSLTEENFHFGKSIVDRSIANLYLNEEVGIVAGALVYSDSIQEIRLRPFKDNVYLRALLMNTYQEMGGTGTDYALYNMRRLFWSEARPSVPKIGVLLTDGRARNPSTAIEQARMAKMEGVYLITVAVGVVTNPTELLAIASAPNMAITYPSANTVVHKILNFAIERCPGPMPIPKPIPIPPTGITPPSPPTHRPPPPFPTPRQTPQPPRPSFTLYPLPPHTATPRPYPPWTTPRPGPVTTPKKKGPCDDCKFLNGVGYNPHETECTWYYQCFNNNGVLIPYQRECPYGLFWDQRDLTCKPAAAVDCIQDPCKKSHRQYSYAKMCRAYWTCRWGRTISSECCPYSHRHTRDRGCVYDPTCPEACPPVFPTQPAICNKRPYPQDKTQYYEDIGQSRELLRRCAPGTAFVAAPVCRCDEHAAVVHRPWECKPDLFLPFNNDFKDYSGQNAQIFAENVTIDRSLGTIGGGAGRFNRNSRVRVWKYANMELGSKFVIRFRYKAYPLQDSRNQSKPEGLVTNSDCMEPCSVSIAYYREGNRTTGKIRTVDSRITQGILPHRDDWNDVEYKYDGVRFMFTLNGNTQTFSVKGNIVRVPAALQIGTGCLGYDPFTGLIDELYVYQCLP